MRKRIILSSLLFYTVLLLAAQNQLNYSEAENQSYELYLSKSWSDLVSFSELAHKQGIDFYYLQMRTGIAWYELHKYRRAAVEFLKAYASDQASELLQEYLYYSLLYGGRFLEANKYAGGFSEAVKSKIGYADRGLTRLAYEGGHSFNSEYDHLEARPFSTEANLGEDYGEAYILKSYHFHTLDLSHRAGANFMLNHSLMYLTINREALVDWGGRSTSPIKINQFQYMLNPTWVIGKKLNVSPSMSLVFGANDVYAGSLNTAAAKVFNLSEKRYKDLVFSAAAWSDFGNVSPGLEINAADINDSRFMQLSSWFTYYPFSNASFYAIPRVYFKSDDNGIVWNAMSVSAGAQMGKAHVSGQYLFGEMENFVESAGYVISNFPGKSDKKLVGSVYFPIGKKGQFVLRYIYQNIIEKYQIYIAGIAGNSLEYNYAKHTITGGLSWAF